MVGASKRTRRIENRAVVLLDLVPGDRPDILRYRAYALVECSRHWVGCRVCAEVGRPGLAIDGGAVANVSIVRHTVLRFEFLNAHGR